MVWQRRQLGKLDKVHDMSCSVLNICLYQCHSQRFVMGRESDWVTAWNVIQGVSPQNLFLESVRFGVFYRLFIIVLSFSENVTEVSSQTNFYNLSCTLMYFWIIYHILESGLCLLPIENDSDHLHIFFVSHMLCTILSLNGVWSSPM